MSPFDAPSGPEILTLDEGRKLGLSRHRLYRSGWEIPFHRLRITPPPRERATPPFSNSELARALSRQDSSLVISHQTAAETWGMWLPSRMQTTQIHLSRVRSGAGIPRYRGTVGHFIVPRCP